MHRVVQRIFADNPPPQGLSDAEFSAFMDGAVTRFEESGFLEETKLEHIDSEDDFIDVLTRHRHQLVVVKFWKRGCLPCLSVAEMYKAAEHECKAAGYPVVFYSVNSKAISSLLLTRFQLVTGTPTVQVFHDGEQIGGEIQAMTLAAFLEEIRARMPAL